MKNLIILFLIAMCIFMYVNRGEDAQYGEKVKALPGEVLVFIDKMKDPEQRAQLKTNMSEKLQNIKKELTHVGVGEDKKEALEDKERILAAVRSPLSEKLQWETDIPRAITKAKQLSRLVMIDFTAQWCGWCKKLDKDTFQNDEVKALLKKHFVCVKIDGDEHPDLVREYMVRGYPNIVFLNRNGSVLYQQPGYVAPEKFIQILDPLIKRK